MAKSPEAIHDELLVLASQDGDADAFARLVRRWQPRLVQHAWRLLGERDAAEDVVQDAWAGIVRRLRSLADPAAFPAWAYRIVGRRAADWQRRVSRRRAAVPAAVDADPGDLRDPTANPDRTQAADDTPRSDRERLRAAIARLPPDHRAILALRYVDDLSTAAIARALDIPEGTVKSRLFHARRRLRDVLTRSST